jgi:proteasome lid subunit RPN8/RPN11
MLRIDSPLYQDLRRHGEETYPHECCGVLLGRRAGEARVVTGVLRCGNGRHDSPQNRYVIDPGELLRAEKLARGRGEEIVGFYHSHPDHPARWSPTDLAEAHWLGCSYVITRVAGGRAEATSSFLLAGLGEEDKRFQDEEIRVGGGEPAGAPARSQGELR